MSKREDPSSLEEALVQLYEERRQKNALAAGQAGVTHAMALLQAETREQAARLEVAYRELDEARAERDRQKARANGLDALLERDPAGLVWLREGVIADLHAAGWPEELPAELVQQRDEAHAARARAESALHAVLAALRAGVPLPPEVLDHETLAEERDAAQARAAELEAEVARLRALLAEPSEEEAGRLGEIAHSAWWAEGGGWRSVFGAILADLRARAGGADV